MTNGFTDKVALVTGAGNGIGAATARAFATEGAAVAAVDLDPAAATATADGIIAAGGRAVAVSADVSRAGDAERAVQEAVAEFGGLDVLVNNAGVIRYGEVPDFSEEDWDFVMNVNLKGPYLMAKYAIPAMRQTGGGAIVNTASVQAFATQKTVGAYSASKGGVVALTNTMALDHAKDGIRVNCIAPGSVRTPMLEDSAMIYHSDLEKGLRIFAESHPLGVLTEPEDVAELILFLASDRARTITGACYRVDGGLLSALGV